MAFNKHQHFRWDELAGAGAAGGLMKGKIGQSIDKVVDSFDASETIKNTLHSYGSSAATAAATGNYFNALEVLGQSFGNSVAGTSTYNSLDSLNKLLKPTPQQEELQYCPIPAEGAYAEYRNDPVPEPELESYIAPIPKGSSGGETLNESNKVLDSYIEPISGLVEDMSFKVSAEYGSSTETNSVTTMKDKRGVRRYNKMESGSPGRGFTSNPFSDKALAETAKKNILPKPELSFNMVKDIYNESKVVALTSLNDKLLLSKNTKYSASFEVNPENLLKANIELTHDQTLTFDQYKFKSSYGDAGFKLTSTAKGELSAGIKADQHGFTAYGGGGAEVTAIKVSGTYDSPPIDVFWGTLSFNAQADLNLLSAGGVAKGGMSFTQAGWRVYTELGLNALLGIKEKTSATFVPNMERLNNPPQAIMNGLAYKIGSIALNKYLSNPSKYR